MNCPYCLEEIKDEAIVCHHCRRDVGFFRPFVERLSALENGLEGIRQAFEQMMANSGGDTGRVTLVSNTVFAKIATALASSVLLAFLFYWAGWSLPTSGSEDKVLNFMSAFVPFLAAIWLGRFSSGISRLSYVVVGLFAGFFGYALMLLVYATHNQGKLNPDPLNTIC